MKLIVCGGRDYSNWEHVRDALDKLARKYSKHYCSDDNWLPYDMEIITGGAAGADELAAQWASVNWAPYREYRPNWKKHGLAAGPIRNQEMLDQERPDLVVAFPGGIGTADMVRRARKAGVEVIELRL